MKKTNPMPLAERLKKAGRDGTGSSAVFRLPLDAYLCGWDELLGGSRFMEKYRQEAGKYASFICGECTLSEAVAFSGELPPVERLELLDGILIEPAAAWNEADSGKTKKEEKHEPEHHNARHRKRNQCRADDI